MSESEKGEPRCRKCSQPVIAVSGTCDHCGNTLQPDGIYYSTGPRRDRYGEVISEKQNTTENISAYKKVRMGSEEDGAKRVKGFAQSGEFVGTVFVWVGWIVGSMVFYKVALDAAFVRDVSIIAAAILGFMVTTSAHVSAWFYAIPFDRHRARVILGTPSNFLVACLPIWVLTALSNIVLGKLIVFGFSKRLNTELGRDVFYDLGRSSIDESFLFAAIIGIPITVHLITILLSARRPVREQL